MPTKSEDWTIDTVILYDCAALDMDATNLLTGIIHHKKMVAFDKDKYIERQYISCLKETENEPKIYPAHAVIKAWFKHVIAKFAVKNLGFLQHAHETKLKALMFHDDDFKFVAVCSCSEDKRLVSHDSDYSSEIKVYLKSAMSIDVLSTKEAIDVLMRPPSM